MTFRLGRPVRRANRLRGYDYGSSGTYFITLVAYGRECIFGDVIDGLMKPTTFGQIVQEEWLRSFEIRAEISPDQFSVMPNHFHALVNFSARPT